ncbi:uncharacterized protein LOC116346634 [Contarinia nasturtii]|uniref:uncharacterized protein LOC116346634 n=1 Tax=Contarinia nasturtii TaxID=265458 RepID=UPI0012D46461|nr:uncharacterized protein LOC116346634 [Contarinia nasturtii]
MSDRLDIEKVLDLLKEFIIEKPKIVNMILEKSNENNSDGNPNEQNPNYSAFDPPPNDTIEDISMDVEDDTKNDQSTGRKSLDLSLQEREIITRCMTDDSVSDDSYNGAVKVINCVLAVHQICILPDGKDSWIIVYRHNNTTPTKQIDVIPVSPEFVFRRDLNENLRKEIKSIRMFKDLENPLKYVTCETEIDKPELRQDQFIWSFAVSLGLAMKQATYPEYDLPFKWENGNDLIRTRIRNAIADILQNGLITDDPNGTVWQQ